MYRFYLTTKNSLVLTSQEVTCEGLTSIRLLEGCIWIDVPVLIQLQETLNDRWIGSTTGHARVLVKHVELNSPTLDRFFSSDSLSVLLLKASDDIVGKLLGPR